MLQPFNDDQISSYLRRYIVSDQFESLDLDHKVLNPSSTDSWSLVKKYEDLFDSFNLTEFIRIPLLLIMSIEILPNLIQEHEKQDINVEEEEKGNVIKSRELSEDTSKGRRKTRSQNRSKNRIQSEENKQEEPSQTNEASKASLSQYDLYRLFTNYSVNRTVEAISSIKNTNNSEVLSSRVQQELQRLALHLNNYIMSSSTQIQVEKEFEESNSLLSHCPLIDSSSAESVKFKNKTIEEYYVATAIVEETSKNNSSNDPEALMLNQQLLTNGLMPLRILHFISEVTAVQVNLSNALKNLILNSRISDPYEIPPLKPEQLTSEDSRHRRYRPLCSYHHHPLSIMAANAITILNLADCDLSRLDFRRVCFAGADLSYGTFESTDFSRADLEGVNFTGAWLKDAKFIKANMSGIQFGLFPFQSLDKEPSFLAQSLNGRNMIVGSSEGILVFQRSTTHTSAFSELIRFKGHIGEILDGSFSKEGNSIVSGGEDRTVRVWNLDSRDCISVLKGHTSEVIKCEFSEDSKHIISAGKDNKILIWSVSKGEWILTFQRDFENVSDCGFVPKCNTLIFVRSNNNEIRLYNYLKDKYIQKRIQSLELESLGSLRSHFSSDGKQMVLGFENREIVILDLVRSHIIKALDPDFPHENNADEEDDSWNVKITFTSCGTNLISTIDNRLKIQNAIGEEYTYMNAKTQKFIIDFSINHTDNKLLKLLCKEGIVDFRISPLMKKNYPLVLTNKNSGREVDLEGANIDESIGLSEENAMTFQQDGDYHGFTTRQIQELILGDRAADQLDVISVDLSDRDLSSKNIEVIGRNTKWKNLERLDISGNDQIAESAVRIANNTVWCNLKELLMNYISITSEILMAVSYNPVWKNLKKLELTDNNINDLGAKSIGDEFNLGSLRRSEPEF